MHHSCAVKYLCLLLLYLLPPLQMGTIIIALTYFAMYVTRFIFVEEVIHRFHSTYLEEFVDVSAVAYWDQVRDAYKMKI